jgi:hypothetical protein
LYQIDNVMNKLNELKEVMAANAVTSFKGGVKRTGDLEFEDVTDFASTKYFYYSGPNDERTRPFCRALLNQDKLYTREDLDNLSRYCGYDVYTYAAFWNCRHKWRSVKSTQEQDTPTTGQINRIAVKNDSNIQNYI